MQVLVSIVLFAILGSAAPAGQKNQKVVYVSPNQYKIASFQPVQRVFVQPQPKVVQLAYQAPPVQTRLYQGIQTVAATYPVQQTVVAAPAAPVFSQSQPKPTFAILRSNLDNDFDGNFQYDFETENGISNSAVGSVKQVSPTELGQVVQGSYSYTAPDGRVITTTYVADENGFQVQGDHLPVAPQEPELPPLIAKSLAYIRSLPPQPENQQ